MLKIANDLFDVVASGKVKIPVNQKYPLKDAQKAHRDLESRGDHRIDHSDAVSEMPAPVP